MDVFDYPMIEFPSVFELEEVAIELVKYPNSAIFLLFCVNVGLLRCVRAMLI